MENIPIRLGGRLAVSAVSFLAGCYVAHVFEAKSSTGGITKSPREAVLGLPVAQRDTLPYPPNLLPGGRGVATPYGSIQVYEWGEELGEKILLLPGISTPVLALSNLAEEFVRRGFRVMMFDLFGRGWSDNPNSVEHDSRLFHLAGYSLGGGLAVCFARYFPHLVNSLILIAPGGLIRRSHVSWTARLLYSPGFIPEWLRAHLVRQRLQPRLAPSSESSIVPASSTQGATGVKDSDARGGDGFDSAVISKLRPNVPVATVFSWQLTHHAGFLPAFMSGIKNAPIYEQQELWSALGNHLAERRSVVIASGDNTATAAKGKILLVLGTTDSVVVKKETIDDVEAVLGSEAVEVVVLEAGHEIPITKSFEIVEAAMAFWGSDS